MKLLITVQGIQYEVDVEVIDESIQKPAIEPPPASPSLHGNLPATPAPAPPRKPAPVSNRNAAGGNTLTSPLAGNVFKVEVKPGQQVEANDVLIILEAMKMETPIKSPGDAVIKSVQVAQGDSVAAGQTLLEFE
ncbi:MAG: acetyl-CoA carboxylase biotin carboxyl carrier protein subunit [Gammaproteobacteria bacterium]|nr:acetyl-CoA carboxylase biotin carboxyl carrier protein subunit [Gammaproteobacteria bacterium]